MYVESDPHILNMLNVVFDVASQMYSSVDFNWDDVQ